MKWDITLSERGAYLPKRCYIADLAPGTLRDGQVAINVPSRRIWIGTPDGIVEVTSIAELVDRWAEFFERVKGKP